MPSLRVTLPGKVPKVYHLYKKITSIGRGEENELVVGDALLDHTHAPIHLDGRDCVIQCLDRKSELHVNGKKRRKPRLVHQDRVMLGSTDFQFSLYDEPVNDEEAAKTLAELNAY